MSSPSSRNVRRTVPQHRERNRRHRERERNREQQLPRRPQRTTRLHFQRTAGGIGGNPAATTIATGSGTLTGGTASALDSAMQAMPVLSLALMPSPLALPPTVGPDDDSYLAVPPVLDQIANLLNLAQTLMGFIKDLNEGSAPPPGLPTAPEHAIRYPALPYERITTDAQRLLENCSTGVDGGADMGRERAAAKIHRCVQCGIIKVCRLPSCTGGEGAGDGTSDCFGCDICNGTAGANRNRNLRCAMESLHQPTPTAANANGNGNGNGNGNVSGNRFRDSRSVRTLECSICLEPYHNRSPMSTICGHIFCRSCIIECVNHSERCPMCSRKLNLSNLFRVFL